MVKYILDSSNFHNLRQLKEVGGNERTIYGRNFHHDKKIKNTESIQKLAHFSDCIQKGMLPDGEVLSYMANCIDDYLKGAKLTLDSAFNFKKGNAALQYSKRSLEAQMFITMIGIQVEKGLNKAKAAAKTIDLYNEANLISEKDVDSFLKQQIRNLPNYVKIKEHYKEVFSKETDK